MPHEDTKDNRKNNNEDASPRPDPETLNKTDPQENMEGPVSSLMHNAGKGFDTKETRDEADKKKNERI
jgi:hypothetical protein